MTSLLVHLQSVFNPAATADLARSLNENAAATQKALNGLLQVITDELANQTTRKDGAVSILQLIGTTPFDTEPNWDELVETDSQRQKAAEAGYALLKRHYGESVYRLTEATASYSGLRLGAVVTLTGLVTSVLMGYLYKLVKQQNLTETQLMARLNDEVAPVQLTLPHALASTQGWLVADSALVVPNRYETVAPAVAFPRLRWVLIGLGVLLVFWLLSRFGNLNGVNAPLGIIDSVDGQPPVVAPSPVAVEVAPLADVPMPPTTTTATVSPVAVEPKSALPKVQVAFDVPGGGKVILTDRSFSYQLAKYLAIAGSQPNKSFLFDNLTFNANITLDAEEEVNDLIQIMKAYPKLHIRVVGHTEDVAGSDINTPLSAAQACFVRDALIEGGIQGNRITTHEEGDTEPIATNETKAEWHRNRHVEIVITQL